MTIKTTLKKAGIPVLLRYVGLEKPFKQVIRYIRDPRNLIYDRDVAADCRAFERQYGSIFSHGSEFANPDRKVLFLSFADSPVQVKSESFFAKLLQVHGITPVMVTASWLTNSLKYYRAFGIEQFALFDQVKRDPSPEARDMIDDFFSRPFLTQDLKNLTYKDVRVGSHVLRTYTRTSFKGSIDFSSPQAIERLRELMLESMHSVDKAEVLLDDLEPELVFTHHPLNIGEGDIFDVALARGIPAIYWFGAQKANHWLFKRYTHDIRGTHYLSLSDASWEMARQMLWTPEHEAQWMSELRARYDNTSAADTRRLQYGKAIKDKATVQRELGLDPQKKTAVVFSHITWDASFLYGEDLFDNYEDWLVQTTRAACDNPAVNWIVKLHPANRFYKARDPRLKSYSDVVAIQGAIGELPGHVKLLYPETDINTWSLFGLSDYCLTVRGTIGIEMSTLGIPVFTAGTGRYDRRGFTIDSASKEEYLNRLAHIQDYSRLSDEQTELAKKHAYWTFLKRPVELDIMEATLPDFELKAMGHPLDMNYIFHMDSIEDLRASSSLTRLAHWVMEEDSADFYS